MKKIKIVVGLLMFYTMPYISHGEDIGGLIKTTLLDHVETVNQFSESGDNRIVLLDSVFQFGRFYNTYIGALQIGYQGITNPDGSVEANGNSFIGSVYIHLNPAVKNFVNFNPQWEFLNSLEFGPSYSYDFKAHHAYFGINVGLAFKLNPI